MIQAESRTQHSKLYHQLAEYYDAVFAALFRERIHDAIRSLRIPPGASVLEVGVGTGLSLPAYPAHARVTAIDLSSDMLEQAQEKVDEHGWGHIQLRQMDALNLEFPNNSFDYVTAFHVVSVVPEPERMVHEMVRVAKPEARIVIINHFRSERPLLASVVDRLDPLTRRLGWRTTLSLDDLVQSDEQLQVERVYKTSPRSLFTIVQATKRGASGVA